MLNAVIILCDNTLVLDLRADLPVLHGMLLYALLCVRIILYANYEQIIRIWHSKEMMNCYIHAPDKLRQRVNRVKNKLTFCFSHINRERERERERVRLCHEII